MNAASLSAALAAEFTPDALDAFAALIGERADTDPTGVWRRLADALDRAGDLSLARVMAEERTEGEANR